MQKQNKYKHQSSVDYITISFNLSCKNCIKKIKFILDLHKLTMTRRKQNFILFFFFSVLVFGLFFRRKVYLKTIIKIYPFNVSVTQNSYSSIRNFVLTH